MNLQGLQKHLRSLASGKLAEAVSKIERENLNIVASKAAELLNSPLRKPLPRKEVPISPISDIGILATEITGEPNLSLGSKPADPSQPSQSSQPRELSAQDFQRQLVKEVLQQTKTATDNNRTQGLEKLLRGSNGDHSQETNS